MKNSKCDAIGFFSARGLSKYWGVSKQIQQSGGKDKWVVKYAQPLTGKKHHSYVTFTAKDFELKEEDAAHVAAYFFDNIKPLNEYPRLLTFRRPGSLTKFLRLNIFTRHIELLSCPSYQQVTTDPFDRTKTIPKMSNTHGVGKSVVVPKVEEKQTSMIENIQNATKATEAEVLAGMVSNFETLSIKQLLQLHYAIDDILKVKVQKGAN